MPRALNPSGFGHKVLLYDIPRGQCFQKLRQTGTEELSIYLALDLAYLLVYSVSHDAMFASSDNQVQGLTVYYTILYDAM